MDPRRALLRQEYGRRGGGVYGSARAIAPTAMPSLSTTGQSFYTVESLQGATMVPPPAPPPPRILPPEPYLPHDVGPRLDPAKFGDFGSPRHNFPLPARKRMMQRPGLPPFPGHREDPGIMIHRRPPPPPFMPEPWVPGGFPRPRNALSRPPRGHRGPYSDYTHPHWSEQGRDQSRSFQRSNARKPSQKTVKPVSQAKSTNKAVVDEEPSVAKPVVGHGKGHKKEAGTRKQGEETGESKKDAIDKASVEKEDKSEGKLAENATKDEGKSNPRDSMGTLQPLAAIVGKKRGVKGVLTQATKKPRKSAATQNDTTLQYKGECKVVQATCTDVMPDADPKAANDAACPKVGR